MSEDNFNLDQVMEEHAERNNSVEELADKEELKQENFSDSDTKELYDRGEAILKEHKECSCKHNECIDNSIRGRLRSKAEEYYNTKQSLEQHQANLWLSTDFKAEGCTNESMRKAFITAESEEELATYYDAKIAYDDVKREYELGIIHLKKKEILVV